MKEITTKVVKCGNCDKFFGWTDTDHKCRFCKTEYGEEEKVKGVDSVEEKPASSAPASTAQKENKKTKKESFRIWKDL